MKSLTNRKFWESYRKLPEPVRRSARKTYRLWLANPRLPSLHFKKTGKVGRFESATPVIAHWPMFKPTLRTGFGSDRMTNTNESFLADSSLAPDLRSLSPDR
jgi:hypothetical protein